MNHLAAHLVLPCTAAAVPLARDSIVATLRGWGRDDRDWLDVVALVVTELVSNAVRHAGGCPTLDLHADGLTTLTVTDRSPVHPRRQEPDDRGGRGLLIVDALCTRWGVRDQKTGKQIWVELPPCPGHVRGN
jgi:anti-sigma regulatory factor (Ser/Thr protein kinase)